MGSQTEPQWRHGVICTPESCRFQVWAPLARKIGATFADRPPLPLTPADGGYWTATVDRGYANLDYRFQIDGKESWPDPASRHQPHGVHGPSRATDLRFVWTDETWRAPKLDDYAIYELHVGTFTAEGTFESAVERLPYLRDLGITAIEIMPAAQNPGARNWGYDGVYPFAVQHSYGGPMALQRFVNACHRQGLAVVLDVVYNHWGPEGNYTAKFGPYFTDHYRTPWGSAVNFDGEYSSGVREFVVENAVYWIREFHVDALRLDAVHGIHDQSAYPILEEIGDRVHAARPDALVIAESDLNDPRLCLPKPAGLGLDAQWSDDFHHSLHALLTGERNGYYADFGEVRHMVRAAGEAYVYQRDYSRHRRRFHGRSPEGLAPRRHVVFSQNHDQIGNRMLGERTGTLLDWEAQKLATGAVLLSAFTPLLFMGEEYGETAPFQYFIDHGDPDLIDAVRRGRAEEFSAFSWRGEPPDPQSPETYQRCKLNWELLNVEPHRTLHRYYRELLRLRNSLPRAETREVTAEESGLIVETRRYGKTVIRLLMNFGAVPAGRSLDGMHVLLDSAAIEWAGPGSSAMISPKSLLVAATAPGGTA